MPMRFKELFQHACLKFLNIPYIWGGDDPIRGLDCSGFVQELYSMIGIDPIGDQTAQGLHDYFKIRSKEGPRQVGTLMFYGKSVDHISHVAMIIDDEGYYIIEAGGGGSKTVNQEEAIKQNAFIRIRPFNRRSDIVAVVTPKGLPW